VTAPLEILVVKSNMLGSARVEITVANRLRLHFSKTIEVELSCKTREFIVVEVLWNYLGSKFVRIFHNEHVTIGSPVKQKSGDKQIRGILLISFSKWARVEKCEIGCVKLEFSPGAFLFSR